MEVYDKLGNRVTRHNGVLQDGDRLRVTMNMMDAQKPALVAAAALADTVRRNELFDSLKGHPQANRYGQRDVTTLAALSEADKARIERNKKMGEAWKQEQPLAPSIKVAGRDETLSPAEQRDARLRDQWKTPTSPMIDNTASPKEIVAAKGPHSATLDQLHAAREATVTARDKRLQEAWKTAV